MYKLGFKEAEESNIKLPTFTESWRKQGNSRKTSTSASLTTLNPLTVWITPEILKVKGVPDHLTCLLRNLYVGQAAVVRTEHEQLIVQHWERSTSRIYIVILLV